MKITIENVERFDSNYKQSPHDFLESFIKEADNKENFTLVYVPQPTKEGVIIDLYSIIESEHRNIYAQFERRYNSNDKTLVLESL